MRLIFNGGRACAAMPHSVLDAQNRSADCAQPSTPRVYAPGHDGEISFCKSALSVMRFWHRLRAATVKLGRIANSDLAGPDQVKYLVDELLERLRIRKRGARVYRLKDGTWVHLRGGTTD